MRVEMSLKGEPVYLEVKKTSPGFYDVYFRDTYLGHFYNQGNSWWYACLRMTVNGEEYFNGRSLPATRKNGGSRANCARYVAIKAYQMGLLQPLLIPMPA